MVGFLKKFILEIIVFVCGASLMILELVASRVLAPFFGTNTFVWTSLIGIILGFLSIGYWFGGRLADKNPNAKILARIIFAASVSIAVIYLINLPVLAIISKIVSDIGVGAILGTIVLFSVPSILLGMVSPYAAKLKIATLDNTGATIGRLYSISTVGSIIGTFLAGFVLIPLMGNQKIIIILSITLLILSFVAGLSMLKIKSMVVFIFLIGILFSSTSGKVLDLDTQYSRVWIYEQKDKLSGRDTKYLKLDYGSHSAMFLDNDKELVLEYAKYYDLAQHFKNNFKETLMMGGGAYSYPKYFLHKYPNANIDVVEIDPKLTELSKKYFGLIDNPRLKIFHQDARVYLNKLNKKYDVIYGDAYKSYSPPFQLSTIEAISMIHNALNEDGVALFNIIGTIEGDHGKFLRSVYYTCKEKFPNVFVIPVIEKSDYAIKNNMIVALKSKTPPQLTSNDPVLNGYLSQMWKKDIERDVAVLTDDYAPVESYYRSVERYKEN